MIIFFCGFEILVIIVVFVAIVAGTADMIVNMINAFVTIFAVKNLVQTVAIGHLKNENPLPSTIAFLAIDCVRMWVFFSNLRKIGLTFVNATGLKYLAALFGFIMYFILCGSIFLLGEFISIGQATGEKKENKMMMIAGIATIVILQIVTWIGYL